MDKEYEITLELLKELIQGLQLKHTGAPSKLDAFKNDNELAPILPIKWRTPSSNKINVTKFSNYAPALFGQSSKSRIERDGVDACVACKKGNGKFADCVQAQDSSKELLFKGSCMNCIFGASDRKCSLSSSIVYLGRLYRMLCWLWIDYNGPKSFTKASKKGTSVLKKTSKTGRHIKIAMPKRANLNTPKGLQLVLEALNNFQAELISQVGKAKKDIDVDKDLVIEDDTEEEEDGEDEG